MDIANTLGAEALELVWQDEYTALSAERKAAIDADFAHLCDAHQNWTYWHCAQNYLVNIYRGNLARYADALIAGAP